MRVFLPVIFVLLIAVSSGSWAQSTAPETAPTNQQNDAAKPEEQSKPSEQTSAPYDEQFMRLAEVLGSIHYLRHLCGANEGGKWRDHMAAMIETEKPEAERKARIIARFNRGYNAFSQSYLTCTLSALTAADRYMKEGVRLTSQINARFGR